MKAIYILVFFFFSAKSFSQKETVLVTYNGKQKLQYTFDKNGDISEYIIFGDHHHPDTTYLGNVSKYKYCQSRLLKRLDYTAHYLSLTKYSYKRGKLVSVTKDREVTKRNVYNRAGKIISEIYFNGIDTSEAVTYKYVGDDLIEKFRASSEVENEKITYTKSGDTIIETISVKDSVFSETPEITIQKKKYNGFGIAYCSRSIDDGKRTIEYFVEYDRSGNLKKIEERRSVQDTIERYRTGFTYRDGIIYTIQTWTLKDDVWRSTDMTAYFTRKSYNRLSPQNISKINSYFTKNYVNFDH